MRLLVKPTTTLTTAAAIFGLSAATQAGEEMAPMAPPPPPAPDCECADPGWTLELTALYLQPGATESEGDEADADFGWRAALGYETATGLAFTTRYFAFEGDLYDDTEVDVTNWDFMIGDRFCCGDKLAVSVAGGLRLGSWEEDDYTDIEGIGPVIGIEVERSLGGPWSLYAGITQALLIGEDDYEDSDNSIYGVTEIAAGVQYAFGLGPVSDAYIRVGGEGQYYYGVRDDDTEDFGLFGGGVTLGFNF